MADLRRPIHRTVELPKDPIYRVAKNSASVAGSRIRAEDIESQAGNRFDLTNEGVVYCATHRQGSFAEVLKNLRRAPSLRISIDPMVDPGFMLEGGIPTDWRATRSIFSVVCDEPLPFLDIEDPETLAFLDAEMAVELGELGILIPLDIPAIRGPDRRLTRAISSWTASQRDVDGNFLYGGIRYVSRLGGWECWAIFEESDIHLTERMDIQRNDPDLLSIASLFQLTIH
jgi:hypothetical protein